MPTAFSFGGDESDTWDEESHESHESDRWDDEGDWGDWGDWDGMVDVDCCESTPTPLHSPQDKGSPLVGEMEDRERASGVVLRFFRRFLSRKKNVDHNLLVELKARKHRDQLKYERIILAEKNRARRLNIPCKDAGVMCESCPWCKDMLAYLSTYG